MRRRPLLAAPALLAGCSVLPERPYVETLRFPLSPERPPGGAGERPRRVLLVRMMRAAPGQDRRGLRSLRPDGTEAVEFYAEWVAPPAEAAEEALRRWLAASGRFVAVVSPGTRARVDLVLETELTALIADLGASEARAGISAVLLREGALSADVLLQRAILGRAPLSGAQPVQMAAAMAAALAAALAELEAALAPYA
ncbi:MAG: ABC-type transport auxiliary lipoprotein family protein [Acetobacteraceae bacterium]|nr:ABC-type transport auxiliary lipoprotein family protein [Acetobacteraceae bacterium]